VSPAALPHKHPIESSIVIHQVSCPFAFHRPIFFIACRGNDNGIAAPTCKKNLTSANVLDRFHASTGNFSQAMEKSIMSTSIRNRLAGTITNIVSGDVVSEIVIGTAAGEITSIITTGSVRRMNLKQGDKVFATIKATEVSVEKE